MRVPRIIFLLGLTLLFRATLTAQNASPRDPQAVNVLQQSLTAMGGVVPSDSVASGTITIVAGSKTEAGTIRILTRGLNQCLEGIQTPEGGRALIYSRGRGMAKQNALSEPLSFEGTITSQVVPFPLWELATALNNPDMAFEFVGRDSLNGSGTYHIRYWNTFASRPRLQPVAELTVRDIWIDSASGLPLKLAYQIRTARGAESHLPVELLFSDYRNVGRLLYPFRVAKSLNGTPWATINIQNVAFNTGLTDGDFPVEKGEIQ